MSHAALAGLVVMCAAPFAAEARAAAEPVAEGVFVERLQALVEAKRQLEEFRAAEKK